jgi:hypothetical protein
MTGTMLLAGAPAARAFEEVEGLLDSRREALDLLRLPFQIEIPVHPSDQMVRFVVEALRRVVQALPEGRKRTSTHLRATQLGGRSYLGTSR